MKQSLKNLVKHLTSTATIPLCQRAIAPNPGDTDIVGPVELANHSKAVYLRLDGINYLRATVTTAGEVYTWPHSNEIVGVDYNTTSDELTQAIELAKLEL